VLGADVEPLLLAPKQALGECFAASGALGVALAAGTLNQAAATVDGVLISALCYSGSVAAMIIGRVD